MICLLVITGKISEGPIFILPTHDAMEAAHHVPTWVKVLPIGLATAGVLGPIFHISAFHGCRYLLLAEQAHCTDFCSINGILMSSMTEFLSGRRCV